MVDFVVVKLKEKLKNQGILKISGESEENSVIPLLVHPKQTPFPFPFLDPIHSKTHFCHPLDPDLPILRATPMVSTFLIELPFLLQILYWAKTSKYEIVLCLVRREFDPGGGKFQYLCEAVHDA